MKELTNNMVVTIESKKRELQQFVCAKSKGGKVTVEDFSSDRGVTDEMREFSKFKVRFLDVPGEDKIVVFESIKYPNYFIDFNSEESGDRHFILLTKGEFSPKMGIWFQFSLKKFETDKPVQIQSKRWENRYLDSYGAELRGTKLINNSENNWSYFTIKEEVKNEDKEFKTKNFNIKISKLKQTDRVWSDKGLSKVKGDVAFWDFKRLPQDYYLLGSIATPFQDIDPKRGQVPTILMIKGISNDILKAPDSFEWVWDDRGTRLSDNVSIYRMKCPEGYVALGDIVTPGINPNLDDSYRERYRCIKKEYVEKASFDYRDILPSKSSTFGEIWKDAGSGARDNVAIWIPRVLKTNTQKKINVAAGTFIAYNQYKKAPSSSLAYSLILELIDDSAPLKNIMEEIDIKGLSFKDRVNINITPREFKIPFFAVKDSFYESNYEQFLKSDYYTLVESAELELVEVVTNGSSIKHTKSKEIAQEESYENSVGATLGFSVTTAVSVEGTGGVKKGPFEAGLTVGTSVETTIYNEFQYGYSWGKTISTSSVITTENTKEGLKDGKTVALYSVNYEYKILREDENEVESLAKTYVNGKHYIYIEE